MVAIAQKASWARSLLHPNELGSLVYGIRYEDDEGLIVDGYVYLTFKDGKWQGDF